MVLWRRVGPVLLVLTLASCVSRVGGTPGTSTARELPAERTAEAVLGDLTTVDPCSLTALEVFDDFGTAAFGEPESFDYCAIEMAIGGTDVSVTIGWLDELSQTAHSAERVAELGGGMYVIQGDASEDHCAQELVFADDITLLVAAAIYLDAPTDLCPVVSAAMDAVVDVVEQGRVEHRVPEENSLIQLDPCAMISDDVITAQPGFAGVRRVERPARHQCRWETPAGQDRYFITLGFTAGASPGVVGDGSRTAVAGRETFVNPYPQTEHCSVRTGHIVFDEIPEYDLAMEQAEVFSFTPPGRVEEGCQAALAVAREVWPRLPEQ